MEGYLFTDPIQLLGFSFIIVAAVIQLILALKVYRDYFLYKSKPTLAFSLTFFAWSFALIFLALERVSLSFFQDTFFGYPFTRIAVVFSILAILFLDLFAFYATFPKQVKKLIIPLIILAFIYLFGIFYSQIKHTDPDWEAVFPPYMDIIMFATVLPLFLIPIITLV